MVENAQRCYQERKLAHAFREMEDLVEYGLSESDAFDKLALLDIMMRFID